MYMDMTPAEYLDFEARAKGIPAKDVAQQIETVTEKTRIQDVRNRLIRNLSKGYRQRVGIARHCWDAQKSSFWMSLPLVWTRRRSLRSGS